MTNKETIKAIFEILEREKEVEKFLSPVEFEILELVKKNLEDSEDDLIITQGDKKLKEMLEDSNDN